MGLLGDQREVDPVGQASVEHLHRDRLGIARQIVVGLVLLSLRGLFGHWRVSCVVTSALPTPADRRRSGGPRGLACRRGSARVARRERSEVRRWNCEARWHWSRDRRAGSAGRSRARSRAAGADVMLNGFGEPGVIERLCGELAGLGVRVLHDPADMAKPGQIAAMVAHTTAALGGPGHPGEQRRHPARGADRGLSARAVGGGDRDQPLGGVLRDAGGDPADARARLGPDHQHRLGARAGRECARRRPMSRPSTACWG